MTQVEHDISGYKVEHYSKWTYFQAAFRPLEISHQEWQLPLEDQGQGYAGICQWCRFLCGQGWTESDSGLPHLSLAGTWR